MDGGCSVQVLGWAYGHSLNIAKIIYFYVQNGTRGHTTWEALSLTSEGANYLVKNDRTEINTLTSNDVLHEPYVLLSDLGKITLPRDENVDTD